jgi:hypothetical protein
MRYQLTNHEWVAIKPTIHVVVDTNGLHTRRQMSLAALGRAGHHEIDRAIRNRHHRSVCIGAENVGHH